MPWSEWITPNPERTTYGVSYRTTTQIDGGWSKHRETNPTGRPTMSFPAWNWTPPIDGAQDLWLVGAEDTAEGGGESCADGGGHTGLTGITQLMNTRYFGGCSYNIIGPDLSTHTDTQVRLQRVTAGTKVNPLFTESRAGNIDSYLPPGTEVIDVEHQPGVDATFVGWEGTITVAAGPGTDTAGRADGALPWTVRVYFDYGQVTTCDPSAITIDQTSPPDTGEAHFDTLGGVTNVFTITADGALAGVQEFTLATQSLVPVSGLPSGTPTGMPVIGVGNSIDWSGDATITYDLYPVVQCPDFRVFTEGMCDDGDALVMSGSALYGYDTAGGTTGSPTAWETAPFTHVDGTTASATTTGTAPYLDTIDEAASTVISHGSWNILAMFEPGTITDEIDVGVRWQVPAEGGDWLDIFLIDVTNLAAGTDAALWSWSVFGDGDPGDWVTKTFPGDIVSLNDVIEAGNLGVVVPPELVFTWVGVNVNCPVGEEPPGPCDPPGEWSAWQPEAVIRQPTSKLRLEFYEGKAVGTIMAGPGIPAERYVESSQGPFFIERYQIAYQHTMLEGGEFARDWFPETLEGLTEGTDYGLIPGKSTSDVDRFVEYMTEEDGSDLSNVPSGWTFGEPVVNATSGDDWRAFYMHNTFYTAGTTPSDPPDPDPDDDPQDIIWATGSGGSPGVGTPILVSDDPTGSFTLLIGVEMLTPVLEPDHFIDIGAGGEVQIKLLMPQWRYWVPCPPYEPTEPLPPLSPIPVVAIANPDGTVTATWTTPTSDGGSPITGYTVTMFVNGLPVETFEVSGALSVVTSPGPYDTISFTVVANNAIGPSEPGPSNTLVYVPPGPEPEPTPPPGPEPPGYTGVSKTGTQSLACGDYHFYITDRGGLNRYFELLPVIRYRWNRTRDAISDANVFVSTGSPECCQYMERMECGRHELVIERNGERVWEGPITRLGYGRDVVEVEAHDVMQYPYRAIMKSAYNNAYPHIIHAVVRIKNILNTELARFEALSPPINVLPHLQVYDLTGTAKSSRSTKAYQRTVWEEIDEMAARGGIDYTVIGRKVLVFDVDDVIGRLRTFTEADFLDEIIVTQYGQELATYNAVTDGEGHWGAIGKSPHPFYGIWEILESVFDEGDSAKAAEAPTVAEMANQAKLNSFGRLPSPVIVRVPDGATLRDDTGILLNTLVPGVRIPLNATQTCRKISQEQKLDKLTCEGDGTQEQFRVTLSPAPQTTFTDDDKETSA